MRHRLLKHYNKSYYNTNETVTVMWSWQHALDKGSGFERRFLGLQSQVQILVVPQTRNKVQTLALRYMVPHATYVCWFS